MAATSERWARARSVHSDVVRHEIRLVIQKNSHEEAASSARMPDCTLWRCCCRCLATASRAAARGVRKGRERDDNGGSFSLMTT